MTEDSAQLSALMCEALRVIKLTLEVLEYGLPYDPMDGEDIHTTCGRLTQYVHRVARFDTPLANALADVQALLEALGASLSLSLMEDEADWGMEFSHNGEATPCPPTPPPARFPAQDRH
jgi:hypothetical protein